MPVIRLRKNEYQQKKKGSTSLTPQKQAELNRNHSHMMRVVTTSIQAIEERIAAITSTSLPSVVTPVIDTTATVTTVPPPPLTTPIITTSIGGGGKSKK